MKIHPFEPVFSADSRILILGSFPSVKSRDEGFYYAHPRNRFWQVLATLFESEIPKSVEEKRSFLLGNRIALWDVCASCEVEGSSDSSICAVFPNDIGLILSSAEISAVYPAVYTNGGTADKLYRRFILPDTGIKAVRLPSTSPANAAMKLEDLVGEWRKIL